MKKPSVLQMGDIERVREARNVLIRNLENPPLLFELARQVGINKNKLNQGFHQVFETSAFDYLRIRRLEQARHLLESKEKNVTEAAFEVGMHIEKILPEHLKTISEQIPKITFADHFCYSLTPLYSTC